MIGFHFSCVTISITTQSRRKWLGSVDIKSFGIGLPARLHLKHWPIQILVASTGPATYIQIDYVRASHYNFPLWTCNSMIHFTENSIDNKKYFSNFSCMFLNPNIFSNLNSNCSHFIDLRNLQEQGKKICYQTLFWPFTVWINCFSHLKNFENSRPSASNFKSFFDH